nr:MAG TPA: hypothetical protein [Caudoviricetes sp.]
MGQRGGRVVLLTSGYRDGLSPAHLKVRGALTCPLRGPGALLTDFHEQVGPPTGSGRTGCQSGSYDPTGERRGRRGEAVRR